MARRFYAPARAAYIMLYKQLRIALQSAHTHDDWEDLEDWEADFYVAVLDAHFYTEDPKGGFGCNSSLGRRMRFRLFDLIADARAGEDWDSVRSYVNSARSWRTSEKPDNFAQWSRKYD